MEVGLRWYYVVATLGIYKESDTIKKKMYIL